MKRADLIILARQVVTCAGAERPKNRDQAAQIGLIEDGAVVTVDGKIVELGTREKILEVWGGDRLDLPDTSVIPGLVDPHCHPLWAGDRTHEFALRARGATYEEIHASGGGIAHTVQETRAASTEQLKSRMSKVVELMAGHGTTTLEAKSGYGLSLEEELRQLEVISQVNSETPIDIVGTCLGAHSLPPEFEGNRNGFIEMITKELLPAVKKRNLARYVDVFCERGAFSCQESEMVLRAAKELGFGLKSMLKSSPIWEEVAWQAPLELPLATIFSISTGTISKP